jgi:hypothetical protein
MRFPPRMRGFLGVYSRFRRLAAALSALKASPSIAPPALR